MKHKTLLDNVFDCIGSVLLPHSRLICVKLFSARLLFASGKGMFLNLMLASNDGKKAAVPNKDDGLMLLLLRFILFAHTSERLSPI